MFYKASLSTYFFRSLLGDSATVPLLVSHLQRADVAADIATALECLTGAGLYETLFVPDDVDEDELFESELEQFRQGKPTDRGDGRPFGSNITRLSQNPEDWERWWRTNRNRFIPGIRYRNGRPYSPQVLIDMLMAEKTPHSLRRHCAEELSIRYGKDFGFETDMPVRLQKLVLARAAEWSSSESTRFQEGAWYFAGYRHE